jgi:FkbM family methyltransferase
MQLLPGDVISDSIAFTGVYELELTRRLCWLARRGGTFVDVGANLGYFSLLWAATNSGNRSVAFEASPRNVAMLRDNVSRNALGSRVAVMPVAVGAAAGRHRFDMGPPEQTGWGGFTREQDSDAPEVDVVRIDEVLDTGDPIALLKIDIEGAEAWALAGCERLLRNRRVAEIWYEQNKPRMRALGIAGDAAQEFLRSVGYVPQPKSNLSRDVVEYCAVPA